MKIKDSFVGVFIKRFVLPGSQYFDRPGFVDFKISGKTDIYARQIFYPEEFFVKLEQDIISKYQHLGKKTLYSFGKKFGYRFAEAGKFENIKDHPGEKIKDWILIASKFVEGTYATTIESKVDVSKKLTDYYLKNFVILRKLGYDYIFAMGGSVGLMSWIFQDPKIEGVIHNIKKTDNYYEATATSAPVDILKEMYPNEEIFIETNIQNISEDLNSYRQLNKYEKISYDKSFQTYLNSGFIKYNQGVVEIKNHRFFLFEVSGTYLLEMELKKTNEEFLNILYEAAIYTGENIFSDFTFKINELFELLSALGWGEVLLISKTDKKIKVLINHFPWSKWYKEIDFLIINGFLSGIFSKILNKKVRFRKPLINLSKNYLSIIFEADIC